MKTLTIKIGLLGLVSLLTGCVSTTYTKTVQVTKDANGNVVSTVVTESIMQPNQTGWPVHFDYLKGVKPEDSK
ncbi:MAG TPA: hypothetical protein VGJ73_09015 [Verrucomicrobiae bacterium]|jgi:hypothetical protein